MALMSLSVKRHHLADDFPIAPPPPLPPPLPPLQSPVFRSASLGLSKADDRKSPSENDPPEKKFRKLDPFLCGAEFPREEEEEEEEGTSESSAEEAKVQRPGGEGDDVVTGPSYRIGHLQGIKDAFLTSDHSNVTETPDPEKSPTNNTGHDEMALPSTCPHPLLSQVGDVPSLASSSSSSGSPAKPDPMVARPGRAEEEGGDGSSTAAGNHRAPSDGDGDPATAEAAAAAAASADAVEEVCPDCGKVFKRRIYLQRHVAREHWSLARIFRCDRCAYETKHQSNLLVHRRTHTGERPYQCGACGQSYTQGHLLKAHIRSRHGADMRLYNMAKRTDGVRHRQPILGPSKFTVKDEDRVQFQFQPASHSRPSILGAAISSPSADMYANFLSCLPGGLRPVLWSSSLTRDISASRTNAGMSALLSLFGNGVLSTTANSLLSSILARPVGSATAGPAVGSSESRFKAGGSKGVSSPSPAGGAVLNPGDAGGPVVGSAVTVTVTPEDLTTRKRTAGLMGCPTEKRSYRDMDREEIIELVRKETLPSSPAVSLQGHGNNRRSSASALSDRGGMSPNQSVFASPSGGDSKHLPDNPLRVFPSHDGRKPGSTGASARQPPDGEKVALSCWMSNTRSEQFSESSQSKLVPDDTGGAVTWHVNKLSTNSLHRNAVATIQNKDSMISSSYNSNPSKSTIRNSAVVPPPPPPPPTYPETVVQAVRSSCPTSVSSPATANCREACCPYLNKLKDLRRNVYRMLCVFTPYLGADDINDDYEADSVDEFLHAVIHSKLDDAE